MPEQLTIPHLRVWTLIVLIVMVQKVYFSGSVFNKFNICVHEFLLVDMANENQLWSSAVRDLLNAIYDLSHSQLEYLHCYWLY